MPGIPTKFRVADLAFGALPPGPAADLFATQRPFVYLGAIGAGLGDFLAARPEIGAAAPNSRYAQVWLPVLQMFAGTPASGSSPATNGVYRDLKQIRDTLLHLQDVVSRKAKFELFGMVGDLEALPAAITDLQTVVAGLSSIRLTLGLAILSGAPAPKVAPS